MVYHEYETDFIKLHWQIEALKGQLEEMERERNRSLNLVHVLRHFLIHALVGLGVQGDFGKMGDAELATVFARVVKTDWRFSRCPNAALYHCRPSALKTLKTGELILCEDCGWDIRDDPHLLGERGLAMLRDSDDAAPDEGRSSSSE